MHMFITKSWKCKRLRHSTPGFGFSGLSVDALRWPTTPDRKNVNSPAVAVGLLQGDKTRYW